MSDWVGFVAINVNEAMSTAPRLNVIGCKDGLRALQERTTSGARWISFGADSSRSGDDTGGTGRSKEESIDPSDERVRV